MTKKPIVAFSIADKRNKPYFDLMERSFKHFHPDIPLLLWDEEKIKSYNDPNFFYRATPIIASELIDQYELVLKLDADQLITGNLDHIFTIKDYDVGCVLNWNDEDVRTYGPVTVAGIMPQMYFNCGLVALWSKPFISRWKDLCQSPMFYNLQFKEQDLLNLMIYFGNYRAINMDGFDTWNGLIGKASMPKFIIKDNEIIMPPQPNGFPNKEMIIKVIHFAGGQGNPNKMVYQNRCNDEVVEYIDRLVKL